MAVARTAIATETPMMVDRGTTGLEAVEAEDEAVKVVTVTLARGEAATL